MCGAKSALVFHVRRKVEEVSMKKKCHRTGLLNMTSESVARHSNIKKTLLPFSFFPASHPHPTDPVLRKKKVHSCLQNKTFTILALLRLKGVDKD